MVDIENAKRNAARRAVADHFSPSYSYIGIGSGSTIVYVVEEIQELAKKNPEISQISYVPTGYQSRQVITNAGLKDIRFDSLPKDVFIDVAFDGADEIDEELNCIKGGGACLYQEKLVATHARKFICVAGTSLPVPLYKTPPTNPKDHRKLQPRLLTHWPTIPIEVEPLAVRSVLASLVSLGSSNPQIRTGQLQKAGPIKTDQDNFIVDAPFPTLLLKSELTDSESKQTGGKAKGRWEVEALAREIKMVEGVLSVGLFVGMNGLKAERMGLKAGGQKPVAAYLGMEDGSVIVRNSDEIKEETGGES